MIAILSRILEVAVPLFFKCISVAFILAITYDVVAVQLDKRRERRKIAKARKAATEKQSS